MTEIDRRTLFGAMGAGLVLASCRPAAREKAKEETEEAQIGQKPAGGPSQSCGGIVGGAAGESALWGDSVTLARPRFVSATAEFKPQYLCAAYMRFEPGGIVVRQAHTPLTGTAVDSEAEQNAIAQKLLTALKSQTTPTDLNVQFRHDNFEDFSLNGQQVLVLFLDNDPALARFVGAGDMPPAQGGKPPENFMEHIVRFTQFSGETLGEQVKKNFTFCALKAVSPPLQGFDSPLAYRMNYWNVDSGGNPVAAEKDKPNTHHRYSMNIHLRYAAKPGGTAGGIKTFPVILDPDTGNMGSNP